MYTGQAESTTVNTDNINFDAEFIKQTKEESSSSEASNTTSGSFNMENTTPNNQSTTFSTNNTAQSGGNGLTLEAIQQTILSYAAKAKLPPNQWGTFTNAVVKALGLMEV